MQEEKDERLKEIIQMKYKLKEREGKLKEMKY